MADLKPIIQDYSPAHNSVSIPLSSVITVTFDRLMDEDSLSREFFVSGPDTDQFIGPGVAEFNLYPDNVSQGDDLLESPGYPGIVAGSFSFETLSGNRTKMTFTPTNPMAALTQYTAHLPEADDSAANNYTGHITFDWTTGSGSIEALPSTASTSVLVPLTYQTSVLSIQTPLEVSKTTPADNAIEQEIDLSTIEIEFNKEIFPVSATDDSIIIKGYKASDHPSAGITVNDDIAKNITVEGKKIILSI
jgi:hypothetical protein